MCTCIYDIVSISNFPVSGMEHHGQGNSQKGEFLSAYGLRGMRISPGGETRQQASSGHGSWSEELGAQN